jgi:hypothetical protein
MRQQSLLLYLLSIVLLVVLTNGQVANVPLSRQYTYNTTLYEGNFDLFWDIVGSEIYIALSVKTQGWLGFGLFTGQGDTVTMTNSDIILAYIDNSNKAHIQDSFAPEHSQPVADQDNNAKPGGKQDLTLIGGGYDASSQRSVVELKRKLITNDPNDYQLTNANLAQGTNVLLAYHKTAKPTSFALGTWQQHDTRLTKKVVLGPNTPQTSTTPEATTSSASTVVVASSIFAIVSAVIMMML